LQDGGYLCFLSHHRCPPRHAAGKAVGSRLHCCGCNLFTIVVFSVPRDRPNNSILTPFVNRCRSLWTSLPCEIRMGCLQRSRRIRRGTYECNQGVAKVGHARHRYAAPERRRRRHRMVAESGL
jgi:hypothetical protein